MTSPLTAVILPAVADPSRAAPPPAPPPAAARGGARDGGRGAGRRRVALAVLGAEVEAAQGSDDRDQAGDQAVHLFVPQGFNRMQSGGSVGRIDAEEESDAHRHAEREKDRRDRDHRRGKLATADPGPGPPGGDSGGPENPARAPAPAH